MRMRRHRACTPRQAKEGRRMMTTMFGNLLTSVGVQLAGVPPAALAPLLWSAVLLVGVRRAIRARERRVEAALAGGGGRAAQGGLRVAHWGRWTGSRGGRQQIARDR